MVGKRFFDHHQPIEASTPLAVHKPQKSSRVVLAKLTRLAEGSEVFGPTPPEDLKLEFIKDGRFAKASIWMTPDELAVLETDVGPGIWARIDEEITNW